MLAQPVLRANVASIWSREDLEEAFEGIEDPRVDRTKKYPL